MKRFKILCSLIALVAIAGCNSSDEQIVRQSIDNQRKQNELIASQSSAVIGEATHLAEGAKELVSHDAAARKDLIAAQKQSQELWLQERASINRQQEALDGERRDIAQQRIHEPVVAAAIESGIELLACLSPLVLAAYALRQLGRVTSESVELGEVLLADLVSAHPALLPPGDSKRLLS